MTNRQKLHLAGYCIGRYESGFGFELCEESIMNIINLVINDAELDEVTEEEYCIEFMSSYFELSEYELAECIQKDLEDSE
jgi:hypothetical protein